jgi:hypothetical protein
MPPYSVAAMLSTCVLCYQRNVSAMPPSSLSREGKIISDRNEKIILGKSNVGIFKKFQ